MMQYVFSCYRLLVCAGVAVLLCAACARKPVDDRYTEAERQVADSTLRVAADTAAIKQLVQKYKAADNRLGVAMSLRFLGNSYRAANRFTYAIGAYKQGLAVAESINDTLEMVRVLEKMGTDYRRLAMYSQAARNLNRALNYCRQWSDTTAEARKYHFKVLNGLGNVCLSVGNGKKAYTYMRQALDGETALNNHRGMAANYAGLGSIMRSEGKADSAWAYYRKAMEENQKANNGVGISLCHICYGNMYEDAGAYDSATAEYEHAYLLMSEQNDRWHYLEPCISLSRIYVKRRKTATAMEYLQEAELAAREVASPVHLAQVNHLFYQVYKKTGNASKALAAFVAYKEWADKVINVKELNEIQDIQLERMAQEHAQEMDGMRADTAAMLHKMLAAGMVLMMLTAELIGLTAVYYSWLRNRRKTAEKAE